MPCRARGLAGYWDWSRIHQKYVPRDQNPGTVGREFTFHTANLGPPASHMVAQAALGVIPENKARSDF